MDYLHLQGINLIQYLQDTFQGHEAFIQFLSNVGDPKNTFLVYFPVIFFSNRLAGIQVMWVAALSEWLCVLLKWILHGERPFWWVQETSQYKESHRPHLEQFSLTCETGPGSPSGHLMVTSSVLFMIIKSRFLQQSVKDSRLFAFGKYLLVLLFCLLVGLSRCYLSTHFPHQVVAGLIAGHFLSKIFCQIPIENFNFPTYAISSAVMLISAPAIYRTLELIGLDPVWSVSLATTWCIKPEWVHLDSTLFFAIVRDSASLLGLGLALTQIINIPEKATLTKKNIGIKVICILFSLTFTRGLEFIKVPDHNELLFYTLSFIKYASLPIVIAIVIPVFVHGCFYGKKQTDNHKHDRLDKTHNS